MTQTWFIRNRLKRCGTKDRINTFVDICVCFEPTDKLCSKINNNKFLRCVNLKLYHVKLHRTETRHQSLHVRIQKPSVTQFSPRQPARNKHFHPAEPLRSNYCMKYWRGARLNRFQPFPKLLLISFWGMESRWCSVLSGKPKRWFCVS